MITYNLKDIIEYVDNNKDKYEVFYEKDLELLGVLIFIYYKTNLVDITDEKYIFHKFMNGLVIHSSPSEKYKILICPDGPSNDFIYIYRYSKDCIISNHRDNKNNKQIKDIIKNIKGPKHFKFYINSMDNTISLINYY